MLMENRKWERHPLHDHCSPLSFCHTEAEPVEEVISSWVRQLKALHTGEAQAVQGMCRGCDPSWQKLLCF